MNKESVYKVLLLGDTNVGKTCFLFKYTDNTFHENHIATIGLDYRVKKIKLKNGKEISLQIWDTAGQDRFRAITKNYYKGAHGIVLIYDITNNQTFENVSKWVNQIHEEVSLNVAIFLAGNKIDLEEKREISYEIGEKLAKELGCTFIEASAKTGVNIDEIFNELAESLDAIYGKNIEKQTQNLRHDGKETKKKCC